MPLAHPYPLHGLVAAPHTPLNVHGELHLPGIEKQAAHFLKNLVKFVFIGGSTGEAPSLTCAERSALARRWCEVTRGTELRVIVHVGSNCLADARTLATEAEGLGATAIAALAPSYFKPRSVPDLVACCAHIASAAPRTPFYYYDIPSLTGIQLSSAAFLEAARDQVPTLAGIKFTNPDLMTYQLCLQADSGAWDLPFGVDEHLLGALAMGARGAVGSGFNFAAPIYHRLLAAFARGDLQAARQEQLRGVQIIQTLSRYGYMGAAKALMNFLGVDVGPPRLPHQALTTQETSRLRQDLEALGFFGWLDL